MISNDIQKLRSMEVGYLGVMDAWLLSSVEVAEICSKVLDWKIKQSALGEQVSQSYLLFIEEVVNSINRIIALTQKVTEFKEYWIRASDYNKKLQNLMYEIYKRLLDE